MEEEVEMLLKANENSKFVDENFEQLSRKYPGKVIAVKNNKVVAVAKDTDTLMKKISQKDLSSVFITSIPPRGVAFIL